MLPNWIWKWVEKRHIFFPTSEIEATPADVGLNYEDVFFSTSGGLQLHGWHVPGSGHSTWLWFHGNGGNVSHRLTELALLHHHLGADVLIFDYQGYGNSQGRPSEAGTYQDARAALAYLQQRSGRKPGPVIFYGHSLGTAIAVEMAQESAPDGLILVSPFTSIGDMARLAFPWAPVSWLVRDKYNTLSRIPKVDCPLLILHGTLDELVPVSHGERLYQAATEPKSYQALPNAGHNDTFQEDGEEYWGAIEKFLAEL